MSAAEAFRCGTVALLGPPNAGKSTLLNALLKQKLAIVAPKPQTTRRVLRGVLALPGAQAVLVDTPGLLEGRNALEWGMRGQALASMRDADLVLALVSRDTRQAWLGPSAPRLPRRRSVVLVTKSDEGRIADAEAMALEMAAALGVERSMTISALKRRGLEPLLELIRESLPEGPAMFPEDQLTDTNLRDAAAEIIREKALMLCREEVPHAMAVGVDLYKEREDGLHEIHATLYVERESQKGIVIGKDGERLKAIGTRARADLERLADAKVFLKLWVKVHKDWKQSPGFLKELGYPSGKKPHAAKA
ncbi:MAG TPA: GTPase Era [bacterium]|nr:GTPase Era [bacterium]